MAGKLGVYLCEGCGIGGCLDVAALAHDAQVTDGVAVTRTSKAFCLEDSAQIAADIESEGLSAVVIGACSARVNRRVFDFTPTAVRRVNLREQVAWSQEPGSEAAQEMATDLLAMGIAAAGVISPPSPHTRDHERHVLVVGGGPAGCSAAVSAASAGYAVTLVERGDHLGGYARSLHLSFPTREPYDQLAPIGLQALIEEVSANPAINVRTGASVNAISGQPGAFEVSIKDAEGEDTLTVGAVIEATGFEPVGAEHFAQYGLGRFANVVSSVQMEQLAAGGEQLRRPSDGAEVQSVVILACDGRADGGNLPYAGNLSSLVALKQALYVRQRNPHARVFIVYEDMQTPGQAERFYRAVQQDRGVFFVRGEVADVTEGEQGDLRIQVSESVLARTVALSADMVVVVLGMRPAVGDGNGRGVLGLRYLQGHELPVGRAGFVDSNFLCFPFETRRTGIYSAGCVHRQQSVAESLRDGAAAALKAVQVVEKSSAGQAVHPRVGELGFPQFFMQKCTSCGRCTQECPFGALELDSQRHPIINPNRCRRCGICMGACPVQVISFPDYSVEMLSAMQKACSLPEDDPDRLRVLVLACENDAYPALDMLGINRLRYPASCRVIPVRCLGSVNAVVVADAIQRGFDGVALLGCRAGEDYQCHFIQGSELLGRRMDNVRETLERLALESDRVKVIETAITDATALPDVLGEFVAGLDAMGPNPMKGF
jgi:quinone-modifying oxidoreductase subunit QmoB